ncbi:D-serine ammonia-lyase [Acetoanaerobium noterae]|jgi:D-serine dehydratase|uniref:D-serine ammonia-lyase n=1 Tax=Acetoanaerobium noterae TaxID=745369 RepID=UPI0028A72873|nr:D-serine ammonia-lyase [Acetoanaerobium noterae]
MLEKIVQGKSLETWFNEFPKLREVYDLKEVLWINDKYESIKSKTSFEPSMDDILDAMNRLGRFASYIKVAFPVTRESDGIIESELFEIDMMKNDLAKKANKDLEGRLFIKGDHALPISGSIKARGGIYEVLKHAEDLAISHGLLKEGMDYSAFDSEEFRALFSQHSIAVGSTGNLGLSIGIISARLGFKVYVHMSSDAKKWKKDLLRSKGVTVIEYESDYSKAVEEGRKQAELDDKMYFVDDENSVNLFLGYAVAALRLSKQLKDMNIAVDSEHPLFVYLPCGVGGGPGGVAYGLKLIFGDNVHCFFAEPTHSPCMLIGMMTSLHDKVSVQDFDIDNKTAADGLAVGRPSGFVGKILENLLSGVYSVTDENLFIMLSDLADLEEIYLEPSALAGVNGIVHMHSEEAKGYIEKNNLADKMKDSVHIAWATGGSMVPEAEMKLYYETGDKLRK